MIDELKKWAYEAGRLTAEVEKLQAENARLRGLLSNSVPYVEFCSGLGDRPGHVAAKVHANAIREALKGGA